MKRKILVTEEQLRHLIDYISINEQIFEDEPQDLTPEEDQELTAGVNQIGEKIITDLGKNKVLNNVKDTKTLNGIASSFLLSKLVPKDFDENPNGYKFAINPINFVGGQQNLQTPPLESVNNITYQNVAGNIIETNVQNILDDINTINQKNFTNGTLEQYYLTTSVILNEKKQKVKIIKAKLTTSPNLVNKKGKNGKLIVLSKGIFDVGLKTPEGSNVTAGMGTKEFKKEGEEKTIYLKGGTVDPKDSKFSFEVLKSDLKSGDDQKIINTVKNAIDEELKARFGDKSGNYEVILKDITIISSASNKFGPNNSTGVVTPTHDNNGNSTGNVYNKPINDYVFDGKKITTNQPGSDSERNWKLAEARGKTLSDLVLKNISNMGFVPEGGLTPNYDIRITDTGGKVDTPNSGLNPGQFAEIELTIDFKTKITEPGSEGAAVGFTQFMMYLTPVIENVPSSGPNKAWNWTWSRGKYFKSGLIDKLFGKPGGMAKRRTGKGTNFLMKNTKFSGRTK